MIPKSAGSVKAKAGVFMYFNVFISGGKKFGFQQNFNNSLGKTNQICFYWEDEKERRTQR